jgi:uncharacterized protein YciI/uncharacterized protein YndB with AHSA1/START domain
VTTVPPIRREVLVDADPQTAFEVFTTRIGQWWPVAGHSVYGAGATVTLDGEQIVERAPDGATSLWGTVTRCEPPETLAFSWHPGYAAERASYVQVTFAAVAGQTLVTLEHSGWEVFADPPAARAEYDEGWPVVLGRYGRHMAAASEAGASEAGASEAGASEAGASEAAGDDTWVALLHRPGPDAPATGTVFEDPRFAEHVAFLGRMREAGFLVAAGPMTDAAGDGMTILRMPGADQLAAATTLATQDDASVAGGLLAVTVRPWQPMMRAAAWT